jgi:hypothetical protein
MGILAMPLMIVVPMNNATVAEFCLWFCEGLQPPSRLIRLGFGLYCRFIQVVILK